MSSTPRLVLQLSTYFVQAASVVGGRIVIQREFAPDDAAGLAAFITEHAAGAPIDVALMSPASGIAELLPASAPAAQRTLDALLARASGLGGPDALLSACDVVNGRIPSTDVAEAWLITGMTADDAHDATRQLEKLGLTPATWAPSLPSELGAVVELLRATPGAAPIVVWEPAESSARLWTVSAAGIDAVKTAPVGFAQIFESVQAELGLKFRAAAAKLFFNSGYDFGEAADRIGGRVAAPLRDALGKPPSALHVLGLPSGQAWLSRAIAKSLGAATWEPNAATTLYGVAADSVSPLALGLLQASAAGRVGGPWLPAWLTPSTVFATNAGANPAPSAVRATPSKPLAAPAPAAAPTPPVPTAKTTPVTPKTPPKPAPIPAPAPVPAKPTPIVIPPSPKPAPAPMPVVLPAKTPSPAPAAVRPASAPRPPASTATPAPAPAKTQLPWVPLLVGLVALVVVVGTIVYIRRPAPKPPPSATVVRPAPVTTPSASPASTPTAAPAPAPIAAALEAEVRRDPLGFKNNHYQFTVSNKGVLTNLHREGRPSPWIRNLGFMRLYGISTLPDGTRVGRRAGDMSSPDYKAQVNKRVRDGAVVFDVNVTHPKFSLTQTFVCLPTSVKVQVRFKATALADNQGPLDAIYGVHLDPADFANAANKPAMQPGELVYATKRGPLVLRYGNFKGPGDPSVIGDPALASFVLAASGAPAEQVLDYEIVLP